MQSFAFKDQFMQCPFTGLWQVWRCFEKKITTFAFVIGICIILWVYDSMGIIYVIHRWHISDISIQS